MLLSLRIQNFALIEDLTLDFSARLNVLTGETGAGKSILIDALRFVLGERAEGARMGVREGCVVEAVFELKPGFRPPVLETFFDPEEPVVILRREFLGEGRTRALINNRTANASSLKAAGEALIDIHGQYDHQLLLQTSTHLDLVDRYAQNEKLLAGYRGVYAEYREFADKRDRLLALDAGREREMDLLKYQIDELERAGLVQGEEEELRHEQIRMANSERLHELSSRVLALLNDEDDSVSNLLGRAYRDMSGLAKLDPSMEPLKGDYENSQLALENVMAALRSYQEGLSFEPERLAEIEKRLDVTDLMKRKYGGSVESALEFLEKSQKRYDELANSELYQKEAGKEIARIEPELRRLAEKLSETRAKAAAELKKRIESELRDLEITKADFECRVAKKEFGPDGFDEVEFLIRINAGQPLAPLAKIVSAGEVSRVMLALKKVLCLVDPVPTLIFDEIDANIGGRLGSVTGKKLKEIAAGHQVLLITHLPQIASFADRHFKVSKSARKGKTMAEYEVLEGEARVKELAQMMDGKIESDIALKHAKEMLAGAKS